MSITEFLLFAIFVMNVVLAVIVVLNNRRDPLNIVFSAFAGSLALWAVTLIFFRMTDNSVLAILFLKTTYIAAIFIACAFYIFIHYFPSHSNFSSLHRWLLSILTALLVVVLFSPGVLITDVHNTPMARMGVQEPYGYWLFTAYFISFFFGSLYVLYRRWKASTGDVRGKLSYILWSVLTAGVLGVYFNLVLPSPYLNEWRFTWSGPVFTAIIVISVFYAIAEHGLFNVRLIATGVFMVLISMALLFDIFIPGPVSFRLVKIGLFLAVSFAGYLLVRSVQREIAARQKIAVLAVDLSAANEELKRLDEAKSEFISIASHQLRAPLTVIKGYVSLLLEGTLGAITDQAKDAMHKVAISAEQLVKLIADMLDLSRIESGRLKYDMKPTIVDDIVDEAVKEFEVNAKAKGLQFVYENKNMAPKPVNADPDKMREVVVNLIDNAIKYTAKGRVAVSLSTQTENGKPWLTLKIQDNGIGISSSDIAKMFTKFGRTEEARKIRPDGMGLGLYLVKKIIDDHGGRVWVESPGLGQGSAFFVQIPA